MIAGAGHQLDAAAPAEIRVAVADERRTIAEALAALIGTIPGFMATAVVSCAGDVSAIAERPPDLVLAGVEPGSRAGFGLVREIRVRMPEVEIVVVTDAQQPDVVKLVLEQRLGGTASHRHVCLRYRDLARRNRARPCGHAGRVAANAGRRGGRSSRVA
jgi:DNA-binding NarL/FixJ family response regulator